MVSETTLDLILADPEMRTRLLNVYLSGFASGVASTAATFMDQTQEQAAALCEKMTDHVVDDRLSLEEFMDQIEEIVRGTGKHGVRTAWELGLIEGPAQSE